MFTLRDQGIDLINEGQFRLVDPGPLHAPIRGLSIKRDSNLTISLETETGADATSKAVEYPSGTVRLNTEQVELVNDAGLKAIMSGVQPHSYHMSDFPGPGARKERSQVHWLTVETGAAGDISFTIEWLENLPSRPFVWPDTIRFVKQPDAPNSIALSKDGFTLFDRDGREGLSNTAARLTIAGFDLCVCALDRPDANVGNKPGVIVYVGSPDDLTRKKIRTALGFALGSYLVEMGHTVYDRDWRVVAATVRSAYSLGGRAFGLATLPAAYLSDRNWQHELGRQKFGRMVNALVENYDDLDLGNLSWNYWHARTATVHIAPAHFGGAIEALQRAYLKRHPEGIATTLLGRPEWSKLRGAIGRAIADADIPEKTKSILTGKVDSLNSVPQRDILASILRALDLDLGADEDAAWRRRNAAAHGLPVSDGKVIAVIRDVKLLEGLFHRMLLRVANAADAYIDYATPGHLVRPLKKAPDDVVSAPSK